MSPDEVSIVSARTSEAATIGEDPDAAASGDRANADGVLDGAAEPQRKSFAGPSFGTLIGRFLARGPTAPDAPGRPAPVLWALAAAPVALGILWRLLRYALDFPIWGDEAMLALNFLDRDPAGFLEPLRYHQVAPLLFLLAEKGIAALLGFSAAALRLLPLLSGLLALLAFAALSRRLLDPLAAAFATGVLAVSYFPVRACCEVKPYASDLLVSTLLLLLATAWMDRPRRRLAPALLLVLVPLATGFSYPSVFVSGAVTLALLATVVRREDSTGRVLWVLVGLLLVGSFVAFQLLTGRPQSAAPALWTHWTDSFPPGGPLPFLRWLVETHTGPLLAHPWGGKNAGSVVSTFLAAAGLTVFVRRKEPGRLVLLLAPFGLTFVAAVLRRYPYGGAARVAQHLAPLLCLMVGAGIAYLVERFAPAEAARRRAASLAFAALGAFALAGMVRDVVRPYKAPGDRDARILVRRLEQQAAPPAVVLALGDEDVPASLEMLLRSSRLAVVGLGGSIWSGAPADAPRVVVVRFGPDRGREAQLAGELAARRPPLAAAPVETLSFQFGWSHSEPVRATLTTFERRPER